MIREIGSQFYTNKNNSKNYLFLGGQKKKPDFPLEKNQSNQQQYQEFYLFILVAKFAI
jgi:hypothetical protein